MKTALHLLLVALATAASHAGESSPWRVRTEWMVVSIPAPSALRLVPALRNEKTTAAAVEEIKGLIAAGQATLHGMPILWSPDGGKATAESVEEIRFPTEMLSPSPPQNFANNQVIYYPMPLPLPPYPGLDTPVAFETRNVGLTLEIETTVAEEAPNLIDINLAARHTTLEKWRRVLRSPKDPDAGIYEQPLFRVFSTTTSFSLASGKWMLFGVYVVPKPEDRIELFLLRATVQSSLK